MKQTRRDSLKKTPEKEEVIFHGKGLSGAGPVKDLQSFRKLLSALTFTFISASPLDIDDEIETGLKSIRDFWGFEEIALFDISDDGKGFSLVCNAVSTKDRSCEKIDIDAIPWIKDKLLNGEEALLQDIPDRISSSEEGFRQYAARGNIKSLHALPLVVEGFVRGCVVVLSRDGKDGFADGIGTELVFVAEAMAGVLERKKTALRVEELMRFERLLSEISATYINLPADEVDGAIRSDLGRLCKFLGGDRCILYLAGEGGRIFKFSLPFIWWSDEDNEFFMNDARFLTAMRGQSPKAMEFFEDLRYVFDKWTKGEPYQFTRIDELPEEAERMRQFYIRFRVKSYMSIPISVGGSAVGALVITTTHKERTWPEHLFPRLRLFGEVIFNGLMRKRNEVDLKKALSEIKQLKERFEADYTYLAEEIKVEHIFSEIVGRTDALKQILVKVKQVAPTNATVLILGETGTGKGLIARAIHNASLRKDRPLIQVNCAALTPTLIESELFGHEKGAFTGAQAKRVGRFELARGTTLFLDEIGELSLGLQAKLLRVLQDGEFERVGGSNTIKTDVRVVAATNRDLEAEVRAGRFRRDLWYRLSIFPIFVPPLRDRLEDIPLFVKFFVEKYSRWMGKKFDTLPQKTMEALQSYSWPGNIRELENLIERAVITSGDEELKIEVPVIRGISFDKRKVGEDYESEYIVEVLKDANWTIEGPRGAAKRLHLKPSTLRSRMQKLGIRRPDF